MFATVLIHSQAILSFYDLSLPVCQMGQWIWKGDLRKEWRWTCSNISLLLDRVQNSHQSQMNCGSLETSSCKRTHIKGQWNRFSCWSHWSDLMLGLLSCLWSVIHWEFFFFNNTWTVLRTTGQKGLHNRIWIKRKNWLTDSWIIRKDYRRQYCNQQYIIEGCSSLNTTQVQKMDTQMTKPNFNLDYKY
jgi:hypothetical protein